VILVKKHPHSNIELPLEDQQRPLNVLLNNERIVLNLV
jgi:hypothetical protein